MHTTKTILFLGSSGFPFGMAAIQRQLQLAKAFKTDFTRVVVVNRKGVHTPEIVHSEKIKVKGIFEGIGYFYTSGSPRYSQAFLIRNFLKIIGLITEFSYILYSRIFRNLRCLVINSLSLTELKYYLVISRICGIKLIYDYVEFMSSLEDRSITVKANGKSFDDVFFNYTDALIIISPFLVSHIKNSCPHKQYLLIPPIIDFEKFASVTINQQDSKYHLFCGSTHYMDVVEFVIQAYAKSNSFQEEINLVLIINGDTEKLSTLKESTKSIQGVRIYSKLPYEDLIRYYKNALSLLIPLQDNLQDKARFPFKISEYTAAAKPIVTTNTGAVMHYFHDGHDALIARTGDVDDFAAKLRYINTHPEEALQIGNNGFILGQKYFNYKTYTPLLMNLLALKI